MAAMSERNYNCVTRRVPPARLRYTSRRPTPNPNHERASRQLAEAKSRVHGSEMALLKASLTAFVRDSKVEALSA
ncbi:hypothetical protein MRX96_008228 [Rhipicephalus microplus]